MRIASSHKMHYIQFISSFTCFVVERVTPTQRQKGRCVFNCEHYFSIPANQTNRHHRQPRSLGGTDRRRNILRTSARWHACHHGIAANYPALEAATCYLIVHSVWYDWNGRLLVKAPGMYEYDCLPNANWDLLPSRMNTMRAASLILFGEHPKPRTVLKELETKWLPRGTKLRYQAA